MAIICTENCFESSKEVEQCEDSFLSIDRWMDKKASRNRKNLLNTFCALSMSRYPYRKLKSHGISLLTRVFFDFFLSRFIFVPPILYYLLTYLRWKLWVGVGWLAGWLAHMNEGFQYSEIIFISLDLITSFRYSGLYIRCAYN